MDYLRFVPFFRSEILEIIPTLLMSSCVEPARIGQLVNIMKVILDCPGKLVDKGACFDGYELQQQTVSVACLSVCLSITHLLCHFL